MGAFGPWRRGARPSGDHASTPSVALPIVPTDDTPVDVTLDAAQRHRSSRDPRSVGVTHRPASRRRTAAALAAVAVFVACGGIVLALATGDDTTASSPDPTDALPSPPLDPTEAAANSAAPFNPVEAVADDDSIARLFAEWVDGWADDERSWAVAYPSPMGLQVLDASGATQPVIEVAAGFEQASQLPLISDGNRTWAVDPARPGQAWLVSTQFVVTDIDRDGRVAFINDQRTPPNIGESSFGAWGPGFDLPLDADVLAVPGRGLFVLPATGGTFEYVLNSVEQISDDRLVAASVDSAIFRRCDEQLSCELYLSAPDRADERGLPVAVEADVWVSPGGRWVIATLDDESTLLDMATGEVGRIGITVRAVDWSDDASLVAMLGRDELVLAHIDRAATVEQRALTLPIAPSSDAVLLVER